MKLITTLALFVAMALTGTLSHAQNTASKTNGAPQNGTINGGVKSSLPETTMDQLEAKEDKTSIFEDPLQGVITNRTITVLGNDFYQYFSAYWNTLNQDSRYSLAVYERPTARWGSEVWIEFRQERVFRTFLSPARQAAKDVAEAAADLVQKNVIRAEFMRMTFINQDLGPEEL